MGWKSLKDAFSITHTVCVTEKGISIGSRTVPDLATIEASTGQVVEHKEFTGFIARNYPALAIATPAELLALVESKDQFAASIRVYTYLNGSIVEQECEHLGYPNVTHDGHRMFENTHSTDKSKVIRWAKQNAYAKLEGMQAHLLGLQEQLAACEHERAKAQADVDQLAAEHPDISAAAA